MSIQSFLQTLKKELEASSLKSLRFVTGNQSADLDSVTSAIGYTYLNYKYDSTLSIPLINIPKQDFRLRRDIKLVLESYSITEDNLFFIEDFKRLGSLVNIKIELSLVDHCNLQGETLIDYFQQDKLQIKSIIDHHADENVFLDADPRIIRTCGSCSSLVFNYWSKKFGSLEQFSENDGEVARLFISPLLIDTGNLADKVEQPDLDAIESYKQILGGFIALEAFDQYTASYHKTIKKAKKDLDGFKFYEVLRKDYKQFKFGGDNIGFSSIGKSAEWLFKTYTNKELLEGFENVVDTFGLQLLVVTPSYTDKDGQYRREFIVMYRQSQPHFDTLEKECQSLRLNSEVYKLDDFSAKLAELGESVCVRVSNQQNLAASRKQIVPAVKEVLDN